MRVKYHHEKPGLSYGNIIWAERDGGSSYYRTSKFAMRGGKFPANHPCAPSSTGSLPTAECGTGKELDEFRSRGYWASCFPEGDGITMQVQNGQSPELVVSDIKDCFGWEVEIGR